MASTSPPRDRDPTTNSFFGDGFANHRATSPLATWEGHRTPGEGGKGRGETWNPTELLLIGVTDAVALIFPGPSGSLSLIFNPVDQSNPIFFPEDPAGTIRSVQYGAFPGLLPSAGPATLITTLTF